MGKYVLRTGNKYNADELENISTGRYLMADAEKKEREITRWSYRSCVIKLLYI